MMHDSDEEMHISNQCLFWIAFHEIYWFGFKAVQNKSKNLKENPIMPKNGLKIYLSFKYEKQYLHNTKFNLV